MIPLRNKFFKESLLFLNGMEVLVIQRCNKAKGG